MTVVTGNLSTVGSRITYDISFAAGVQFFFEARGTATGGGTLADPILRLYQGATLLTSNDDGGVGFDSRIVYTFATTGIYRLEVGDVGDNNTGTYTLDLNADDYRGTWEGTGPNGVLALGATGATGTINYAGDQDLFAVGLTAGTQYYIELQGSPTAQGTLADPSLLALYDPAGTAVAGKADDDGGIGANSRLVFTPATTGTYSIATGAFGSGTGTYRVTARVDDFRGSYEGNGASGALVAGTTGLAGTLSDSGDRDLFVVSLTAGTRYILDVEGAATGQGTLADPSVFAILGSTGTKIATATGAEQDGGAGNNARMVFTPATTSTYYLDVGGIGAGTYRVFARADDLRSTFEGVDTAGLLTPGAPGVNATIDYAGDVDIFLATLTAGTRYYIDMQGSPTGAGTLTDTVIATMFDAVGTVLPGTNDDDSGIGTNSRVAFTPAASGTYAIAARGFSARTGTYNIGINLDDYRANPVGPGFAGEASVGAPGITGTIETDGDIDLFSINLVAGTQYFIDLEGAATGQGTLADPALRYIYSAGDLLPDATDEDSGVGANAGLVFTPGATGTYLIAAGAAPDATGSYRLLVRPDDIRSTPDGTGAPGILPLGAAGAPGTIDYTGDVDLFSVDLVAGTRYAIDLEGTPTGKGTLGDSYLTGIYDPAGTLLPDTTDTDGGVGNNARLIFTPATTGTYQVAARGWGAWLGSYRLFARPDDFKSTFEGNGSPGTVAVGQVGATGSIDYEGDRDLFTVSLVAGTRYFIDLEGEPTAQGTLPDPTIYGITNNVGTLVPATSDADGGVGRNARTVFTPSATGVYVISAGDLGAATGTYRLLVQADDWRSTVEGAGTAPIITPGTTAGPGTINFRGDVDMFTVALAAGTRYAIDLEGSPTNRGTLGDSYLAGIYDPAGTLLPATTDDDSGVGNNSRVIFTPATAGTYTIAATGWGAWTGTYQLFVRPDDYKSTFEGAGILGTLPLGTVGTTGTIDYAADQDLFTVSLLAGKQYIIDLEGTATTQGTLSDPILRGIYNAAGTLLPSTTDDDGGIGTNARVVFTPTANGIYSIAAGGLGSFTGTYRLRAIADDYRSTVEGVGPAGSLVLGSAGGTGTIEYVGDRDIFTVNLVAGTRYTIDLEGTATSQGTLGDAYLAGIYDSGGTLIASDDDGGVGANARVVFTPATSGAYAIAAAGWGAWTGTYRVMARPDDFRSTWEGVGAAGTGVVGGTATGTIDYAGDQDLFTAAFTANHLYRIEALGSPSGNGTLADPYLRAVYNPSGNPVANASNDDANGSRESSLDFLAYSTGTYAIAAGAYASNTGTYKLRITDLSGPDLASNTTTKGSISVGNTVRGLIEASGEADWFATTLVAGAAYVIEEISIPDSANPVDDPYIRGIYTAGGVLVPGTTNDDWAGGRDSRLVFTPTASGTYYISAAAFAANTGEYRLSLDTTNVTDIIGDSTATTATLKIGTPVTGAIEYSRDRDWFAVTLAAGNTYRIREQGAPSGNGSLADPYLVGIYDATGAIIPGSGSDDADGTRESRTTFTPSADGTYFIAAAGYNDYVGTYRLSVELDTSGEVPANSTSKATVAVGGTLLGAIDDPGDHDWIGFKAAANTTYTVKVTGLGTGGLTLADPVLGGIYAPSGQAVQNSGNDDSGGTRNAQLTFTAPTAGTYFIDAQAWGNGIGGYQVSVTQAADITAPSLVFTTPADNTVNVPVSRNITLDFNEPVRAGTGNFVLTGGLLPVVIAADSPLVTYTGEVVSINPIFNLEANTTYSVLVDKGAVKDIAGNSFTGITDPTRLNFTTAAASPADSWTLMVYVDGDNNLEGAAIADINEMENVALPANVNLVVMVDRAAGFDTSNGNWTDTRRGQIAYDPINSSAIISPLASIGEQNMGKGSTLTSFINWAAATAPAANYGLILWDHGGGIAGSAWDDTSNGDNLSVLETRQAIAASNVSHFGLIGFDECLMAITEQTMDLRTRADVIVSSQESEPGDGWEYDKFLAPLAANPGLTPMDLGAAIVKTYGERYAGEVGTTLSSVWTGGLGTLDSALDGFCTEALAVTTTAADWTAMREAAARAHHFGGDGRNLVDLRDFMNEVVGRALSPSLKTAARAVASAVGTAVTTSSGTVADAAGMSIYLPYGNTAVDASYTAANFNFLNDVPDWDNFLALL